MKCLLLTTAGVLLTALSLSAAEPVAAPTETNFLTVFAKGGLMMYPLIVLSVITVLLILTYLMTIRRNAVVSDRFMNAAEAMIRKRDFLGLIGYCHRQNESIARVTHRALDFLTKNPGASFNEVRELASAEGSRQAGSLSSRITYLADIGAIAPMIGLLGTVIGMIKSFISISAGEVQGVRQMELASGVSEALITTASGLAISIPALIFYAIFRGRVYKYVSELEAAATHLIALLSSQVEQRPTGPSYPTPPRNREEYGYQAPAANAPLGVERPDLHGI
jgi:biopolymer transport protein ExbB